MTIWHWLVLIIVATLVWGAIRMNKKAVEPPAPMTALPKPVTPPGTGVGGWLALLVVGLVLLGPLRSVQQISESLSSSEATTPQLATHPIWESYKTWTWAIVLSSAALSIFTGVRLSISREASVVKYAIAALWLCGPVSAVAIGIAVPLLTFGAYLKAEDVIGDSEVLGGVLGSTVVAIIWTIYLANSKRVRDTYVLNPQR